VFSRAPKPASPNIVPAPTPEADESGRRAVGVFLEGSVMRGFPTPSGKLEFYSSTLTRWGWPEHALPGYARSHVHPAQMPPGHTVLISTFRLPVQIHTRSANAKWLDEIAHTNPLWMHPSHADRLGVRTGDLVRVETEIGHFVVKAWVTEGILPGIVACSHHMGRWKTGEQGQRQMMATVAIERQGSRMTLRRLAGAGPYASADPDTRRLWWSDSGVHQNLTFPVHPDPISGMHCWHQSVRVVKALPDERDGEIVVDTQKSREVYRRWIEATRPASTRSPGALRRPYWLLRPLKPAISSYAAPVDTAQMIMDESMR
jgi:anaerobic selenocysteine-containing dehydrogenase